jgi:hypothetical protein
MAKLTGKKKAEFLARMEKGRKRARRANGTPARKKAAAKKTAQKKNAGLFSHRKTKKARGQGSDAYTRHTKAKGQATRAAKKTRRNSDAEAAAMYETFHGKAPGRIVEYDELVRFPHHFAELGKLKELRIDLDSANPEFPVTGFGDCLVVSTPDGENIYFVGGDQSMELGNLEIGGGKDFIELGPCVYIRYHTTKSFHDFEPFDYYHEFGEEDGIRPMLAYDRLNKGLFLMGGNYQVKREGIVN